MDRFIYVGVPRSFADENPDQYLFLHRHVSGILDFPRRGGWHTLWMKQALPLPLGSYLSRHLRLVHQWHFPSPTRRNSIGMLFVDAPSHDACVEQDEPVDFTVAGLVGRLQNAVAVRENSAETQLWAHALAHRGITDDAFRAAQLNVLTHENQVVTEGVGLVRFNKNLSATAALLNTEPASPSAQYVACGQLRYDAPRWNVLAKYSTDKRTVGFSANGNVMSNLTLGMEFYYEQEKNPDFSYSFGIVKRFLVDDKRRRTQYQENAATLSANMNAMGRCTMAFSCPVDIGDLATVMVGSRMTYELTKFTTTLEVGADCTIAQLPHTRVRVASHSLRGLSAFLEHTSHNASIGLSVNKAAHSPLLYGLSVAVFL